MLYTFADLGEIIANRPPRLGPTRLICVDGTAGSGKSTFASRLGQHLNAPVVHMDDLYEGWNGTFTPALVGRITSWLIAPIRAGLPAGHPVYDWHADRFGGWVELPPTQNLIIEGVRSGDRGIRDHASLLVWVESDPALRLDRVLRRDGEAIRAAMLEFQANEQIHFAHQQTQEAADLIVRGDPQTEHPPEQFEGTWQVRRGTTANTDSRF